MSYKTIVVCLNEIPAAQRLIDVSAHLAAQFQAHIRGLYVVPAVQVYGGESYTLTPVVFDARQIYFNEHSAAIRSRFEETMQRQGASFDFQLVIAETADISQEIVANTRCADLLVMAAPPPKGDDNMDADAIERVVLASGRPVLVLPSGPAFTLELENVLVGWNGSREATRAFHDAMPFMKASKLTQICSVDTSPDGTVPGADMAESLNRHGVKVTLEKVASDGRNAGETLLRAANDFGAGLLVMGCYGHGRFSEMVFGGATRHVLAHLDRAVLMTH